MSRVHYIWGIPLLFLAMMMASSAATVFDALQDYNPIVTVAWRFQITFVI